MEWHAKNRSKDGFVRILADSKAMKHIEEKWPSKFKDEPHSIRFGLAIDGVFRFSFLSSNVCLAPFIDEMQLLWKGIRMYDI